MEPIYGQDINIARMFGARQRQLHWHCLIQSRRELFRLEYDRCGVAELSMFLFLEALSDHAPT